MGQDPHDKLWNDLFEQHTDLNSTAFQNYIGAHADKFGTENNSISAQIFSALRLKVCIYALLAHVVTKPEVPAVVAVEHVLAKLVGEEAFTDDMKQYTGWRVRQIIEFLGGGWVRAGVRVRGSRYKTGSIYAPPSSIKLAA
jgi:hypothetical protein